MWGKARRLFEGKSRLNKVPKVNKAEDLAFWFVKLCKNTLTKL